MVGYADRGQGDSSAARGDRPDEDERPQRPCTSSTPARIIAGTARSSGIRGGGLDPHGDSHPQALASATSPPPRASIADKTVRGASEALRAPQVALQAPKFNETVEVVGAARHRSAQVGPAGPRRRFPAQGPRQGGQRSSCSPKATRPTLRPRPPARTKSAPTTSPKKHRGRLDGLRRRHRQPRHDEARR